MSRTPLHRQIKHLLQGSQRSAQQTERALASDRRHLLRAGSALLLWQGLPACMRSEEKAEIRATESQAATPEERSQGLVIIGAGLAGLTAAYELSKAGIEVSVYEASPRLGGRAFTQYDFNADKMFIERGGEFIDTGHEAVQKLVTELGLELQPLHQPEAQALTKDLFHFGGRYRSEAEVIKAFAPLARIIKRDQKHVTRDGELFVPTYKDFANKQVRRLDLMSLQAYLDACRNQVAAWVLDLVRIAYVGEYGLEADKQSAINLLILIDSSTKEGFEIFGESDEAFRIKGGTSALTQALEKALQARSVPIHRGYRLIGIKEKADSIRLSFATEGGTRDVLAARSILALPFAVLKDVDGIKRLPLSPRKQKAIQEWGFGSNAKLIVGYKQRYWRKKGPGFPACEGSVLSDLPLQQVWESSRVQSGNSGILTGFFGGNAGRTVNPNRLTTFRAEVDTLFPGIDQEFSGEKMLEVWTANPLIRGSYTCPAPGQYTELVGVCAEAEMEGRLLFAGEHCSVDYGGYLNGAVESGKEVSASLIAAQTRILRSKQA